MLQTVIPPVRKISHSFSLENSNRGPTRSYNTSCSVLRYILHFKSEISQIINHNISTSSELLRTSKPFYGKNNLAKWIFIIKDLTDPDGNNTRF